MILIHVPLSLKYDLAFYFKRQVERSTRNLLGVARIFYRKTIKPPANSTDVLGLRPSVRSSNFSFVGPGGKVILLF